MGRLKPTRQAEEAGLGLRLRDIAAGATGRDVSCWAGNDPEDGTLWMEMSPDEWFRWLLGVRRLFGDVAPPVFHFSNLHRFAETFDEAAAWLWEQGARP